MIKRFISFVLKTGLSVALMLYCIGFASYIGTVISSPQPEINANMHITESIIVLTGGSERLNAGVDLLLAGKGKKLLITGVHPDVRDESVIKDGMVPEKILKCCVVLGRNAGDTYGNAKETKEFLDAQGYKTMTLVTAHYHMPRSLLVFEKLMPGVKIVQYNVSPNSVNLKEWWSHSGTLKLLIVEYSKYALVWLKSKIESFANV